MDVWGGLLEILILLSVALVLGTLAEQVRQSALVGYILAGALVGPHALGWIQSGDVHTIAELGVTLLLFSIGLEFSFGRLLRIGPITFVGGTLQVLITMGVGWLVALGFGIEMKAAIAIGAVVALSSTASVIRVLVDTQRLDSIIGRNAVGILLLQDIAVVPLVLVISALGQGSGAGDVLVSLGRTTGLGAAMFLVLYLLSRYLIPKILRFSSWATNRELPIIFATVLALGASWASHAAGLSPSFGAFLAGMLLAGSPFAAQIRSDISPLRTVLVTLFFAAIGTLANGTWIANNAGAVAVAVVLIVFGKWVITGGVVRLFRFSGGQSAGTGLSLAQVGEFSFVLATTAVNGNVIDDELFALMISATVITLFLSPYMVRGGPSFASLIDGLTGGTPKAREDEPGKRRGPVVLIVGFGPSGQRVVQHLAADYSDYIVVLDNNSRHGEAAGNLGVEFHAGDATQAETLEHAGAGRACAIVVTVPDPHAAVAVVRECRGLSPNAQIVVRSRYHRSREELLAAGAEVVVDEEYEVGGRLAQEAEEAVATGCRWEPGM